MITPMKNKHINRFRISEAKFKEILKYFCLDLKAIKITKICHISQKSLSNDV